LVSLIRVTTSPQKKRKPKKMVEKTKDILSPGNIFFLITLEKRKHLERSGTGKKRAT